MPRKPLHWQEELLKCGDTSLAAALTAAIEAIFEEDLYLFQRNVHERTIAAALAFHMRGRFDGLNIDAEFNKVGEESKKVHFDGATRNVVPDIIVHQRGVPYEGNLLAIEIKCAKRGKTDKDLRKLEGIRKDLKYKFALFVRFDIGEQAGNVTELHWV